MNAPKWLIGALLASSVAIGAAAANTPSNGSSPSSCRVTHVHQTSVERSGAVDSNTKASEEPESAAIVAFLTHFDCGRTAQYWVGHYGWNLVTCPYDGVTYWAFVQPI